MQPNKKKKKTQSSTLPPIQDRIQELLAQTPSVPQPTQNLTPMPNLGPSSTPLPTISGANPATTVSSPIESTTPSTVDISQVPTQTSSEITNTPINSETQSTSVANINSSNNNADPITLIKKYFPPDEWGNAIAVMRGESGGDPQAIGDNFPINGEVIPSVGLFQIRTLPGRPDAQTLLDPETNVAYAAQLWQQNGGRWSPTWSAATKLGIK